MPNLSDSAELIAGGGSQEGAVDVGKVELSFIDDGTITTDGIGTLSVVYTIEDETPGDSRDDWFISDLHFDFGASLDDIPTTKKGNPQIGKFDFGGYEPDSVVNDGTTATITISNVNQGDLEYWAAHSVVEQRGGLDALEYALPDVTVTMKITDGPSAGDDSYFDVQLTSAEAPWLDGTYDNWCVDVGRTINPGSTYNVQAYSSYEHIPDGVIDKPENLDAVNYLLNSYAAGQEIFDTEDGGDADDNGYEESLGDLTYGDIQKAIWSLIDNSQSNSGIGSNDPDRWQQIAAEASVEGQGFEPGCDDVVGLILVPVNGSGAVSNQVTIAQVTLAELEVPCEARDETAWGITDGIPGLDDGFGDFGGSSWAEYNEIA